MRDWKGMIAGGVLMGGFLGLFGAVVYQKSHEKDLKISDGFSCEDMINGGYKIYRGREYAALADDSFVVGFESFYMSEDFPGGRANALGKLSECVELIEGEKE